MRKIGFLFVISGLLFFGWNLYYFCIGSFSYSSVSDAQFIKSEQKPEEIKKRLYESIPKNGQELGTLMIPRLEKTFPIYQGTDEQTLKKGIGHFTRSALPGENNLSVLSGHRDTVFRGLKDLKVHDQLIVTTEAGEFLYKIKKIRIVEADDRTVIRPKPKATLTLTTCYPFYFIGDAPQRYIVEGELIQSN